MWKLLPSLPTHKKIKICYLVHSKQFQFLIINFITFIEIKWESWNSQMSSIPIIFGFITFEIFKFALYVIGHQRRPSSRREKKKWICSAWNTFKVLPTKAVWTFFCDPLQFLYMYVIEVLLFLGHKHLDYSQDP